MPPDIMMDSLNKHARVEGGFSSIRSVVSMEQVRDATEAVQTLSGQCLYLVR